MFIVSTTYLRTSWKWLLGCWSPSRTVLLWAETSFRSVKHFVCRRECSIWRMANKPLEILLFCNWKLVRYRSYYRQEQRSESSIFAIDRYFSDSRDIECENITLRTKQESWKKIRWKHEHLLAGCVLCSYFYVTRAWIYVSLKENFCLY